MTSQANGSQLNVSPDLPAVQTTAAPAADATVPSGAVLTAAVYAEGQDLAEQDRRRRIERRTRRLLVRADRQLRQLVRDPDGGHTPVQDMQQKTQLPRAKISDERARNSHRHDRVPRLLRLIPKCVLVFDSCLLVYFFAGITNVNWGSPLSFALAVAVVLGGMVTILSYGCLWFTGDRLCRYKDHASNVPWVETDAITRIALGTSLVVITVIAILMFVRMRTEVLYSLGNQAQMTALVVGAALAVVSVAANLLVIGIHAVDGSTDTAYLDMLSAPIQRPNARAQRMRERAARRADVG